ncbi:hypothetical protein [Microbispora sp. GKU 823]|uniref:hypothetical protein n=1 Tax=Microbispora sp. GKU 823 TaxID=1652100 RepID=UPI00117C10BF|nr:hypothetical protein [Microbispora sp. GKU 823]
MEVLVALLAFAGAVLAGITTGVLVGRLRDEPAGWLIAWSIATGALALSLGAIAVGHLTGFGPVTFRAYQITGSLLARSGWRSASSSSSRRRAAPASPAGSSAPRSRSWAR